MKTKGNKNRIQFEVVKWSEYFPGKSNNKYISIKNAQWPNDFESLVKLFDKVMKEREAICKWKTNDPPYGIDIKLKKSIKCAVLIPSAGKDQKWLGTKYKEKSTTWAKLNNSEDPVQIIFVVPDSDKIEYEKFAEGKKNVQIASLDGFGIGYGRNACVTIARYLNKPCAMIDDRIKEIKYCYKEVVNIDAFEQMMEALIKSNKNEQIISSTPFGVFQVFTVINPTIGKYYSITFPKYFFSSKEDMALKEVVEFINPEYEENWRLFVSADTNNSSYSNLNKPPKGKVKDILNSELFEDLEGNTINWKYLQAIEFKNSWDGIKLQDATLHALLNEVTFRCKELSNLILKYPEYCSCEFKNLLELETLVNKILEVLKIKPLKLNSIQEGIDWLNSSIEPYKIYSFDEKKYALEEDSKNTLQKVLTKYKEKLFSELTEDQLKELASDRDGKVLKRKILNIMCPQHPVSIKELTEYRKEFTSANTSFKKYILPWFCEGS